MKRIRWQAVTACCSILAITALTFWFPTPSGADLEGQNGRFRIRPSRKGLVPEVTSKPKTPTNEAIVYLKPGSSPAAVARAHGLTVKSAFKGNPNIVVMAAPSLQRASTAQPALDADPRVDKVFPNYLIKPVRHQVPSFSPNDPYFNRDTPVAGFRGWWHLDNQYSADAGTDLNVLPAWLNGWTGYYVYMAAIDDGEDYNHPDLTGAYLSKPGPNPPAIDLDWDFGSLSPDGDGNQQDGNPFPVYNGIDEDSHGTAVAGVMNSRGRNLVGGSGAAPHAFHAMFREDFEAGGFVSEWANAISFHSSGGDTQIKIKNHSYGATSNYDPAPAEVTELNSSAAAGTIHVFSAGNYRGEPIEDANKMDLQGESNAICIAASGSDKKFAHYSNFGANIDAAAPSNSGNAGAFAGVLTTDRMGGAGYNRAAQDSYPDDNYTSIFGGTSSSAPAASGVFALAKQANPNMDVRFLRHLLARTCVKVDPTDSTFEGGWVTNAAGFSHNQNYGFGVIDAAALTTQARLYGGVTPLTTQTTGTVAVNQSIPDFDADGVERTFILGSGLPLEDVLVTINATHTYRGDLEAYLVSPTGTASRLMIAAADATDNLSWQFRTNQFWGVNPAGTWTLVLLDVGVGDLGTWTNFSVTARMGTLNSLTVSSTSVPAGNPVTATWYAPAGSSATDWIGFYQTGADNRSYLAYKYTNGATTGTFTLNTPGPGTYEFRYLLNNGYTSVTKSPTVTVTAATYTVDATPEPVGRNQTLNVAWTAPAGRSTRDWIAVFPAGAPNTAYQQWIYTGGAQSGNFNFTAPSTAGNYEVRYLLDDGYYDVRATDQFVVN